MICLSGTGMPGGRSKVLVVFWKFEPYSTGTGKPGGRAPSSFLELNEPYSTVPVPASPAVEL